VSVSSANKKSFPQGEDALDLREKISHVESVILDRSSDPTSISSSLEDIEIQLLLEGIYQH
jgi:hypothetical protein